MPLAIIRNDLTKMNVDAIVNAANSNLQAGGGVCGAIFSAAGADRLQRACSKLSPIRTGEAVITKGFSLPAKYIIHAVGPVYSGGDQNEEALLASCYNNALKIAASRGCRSIAFPLISSGIYGYPKDEALAVATRAIGGWLMENEMDVSLVVFDKAAFALSSKLHGDVRAFIDEYYVEELNKRYSHMRTRPPAYSEPLDYFSGGFSAPLFDNDEATCQAIMEPDRSYGAPGKSVPESMRTVRQDDKAIGNVVKSAEDGKKKQECSFDTAALPMLPHQPAMPAHAPSPARLKHEAQRSVQSDMYNDVMKHLDEPFSATLLRMIDAKGKTDVDVYKKANLDRKLFSKIRTGKGYMPSKKTAIALAVALELSLAETRDLLGRAGFALSRSVIFDVIVEYFITRRRYDIYEINNVLFEYDQQLLGG